MQPKQKMSNGVKIYVVPQQHWDPWWTFGPKISERMGVNNVRKALDIMNENPDFKYVIGQVYLWDLFKKYFPERTKELKKRVAEGRIELGCGGYVNPDFNLPSGESIIRQLAFGKKAWEKEFGTKPETVWIQDSFGQSAQLPQIFSKLGLKFHTAKRGPAKNLPANFVWEGVDGSQILFDRQPLGHHGITQFPGFSHIPNPKNPWEKLEKILRPFSFPLALIALYLPDPFLWIATKGSVLSFRGAVKYLKQFYPNNEIFVPHGFGFDGAMPFEWIVSVCQTYSRLTQNQMFISSPSAFFKSLEKRRNRLPVIKGELNGPTERKGEASGTLPGTYSTRIEVKKQARQAERLLYLAEFLETIKFLTGSEYQDISELWRLKFLTDFHDSIAGSLTDENYKILQEKAFLIKERGEAVMRNNLKMLCARGTVFNPLPWPRKDIVQENGKWSLVEAGPAGISPLKILGPEKKIEFDPPAGGEEKILITPFYKVKWGESGLEIYQGNRRISGEKLARLRLQRENGDAYFFDVSGEKWDEVKSVNLIESNDWQVVLEIKSKLGKTEIIQKILFYVHTPRIDFLTQLNNQEKNARIQVCLPFNIDIAGGKDSQVVREIPAGFLKEGESPGQARWKDTFGERFAYYDNIKCVQNWIYFGPKEKGLSSEALAEEGVAIFNDGLPEHEIVGNNCFITLLRCVGRIGTEGKGLFKKFRPPNVPWRAGTPHPIPLAQEPGEHEFRYAIYPGPRENIVRECYEFLFPLILCQGEGNLNEFSLFSLSDKNVIPLTIKKSERGNGVVVRLLETEGVKKSIQIKLSSGVNFRSVRLVNLMEEKISDLIIENNTIKLQIKPQEIITLILEK